MQTLRTTVGSEASIFGLSLLGLFSFGVERYIAIMIYHEFKQKLTHVAHLVWRDGIRAVRISTQKGSLLSRRSRGEYSSTYMHTDIQAETLTFTSPDCKLWPRTPRAARRA
jgi:hypothetical protein